MQMKVVAFLSACTYMRPALSEHAPKNAPTPLVEVLAGYIYTYRVSQQTVISTTLCRPCQLCIGAVMPAAKDELLEVRSKLSWSRRSQLTSSILGYYKGHHTRKSSCADCPIPRLGTSSPNRQASRLDGEAPRTPGISPPRSVGERI